MSDQQVETPQPKEKIVFEFQHTDELGNPIIDPRTGKQAFTNLTGETHEEVLAKLKDSYLNVTRAYVRAKNHKPVPKAPDPQVKELSAEEERQLASELNDPSKARTAIRKLAGTEGLEERERKVQEIQDRAAAQSAAYQFMSKHLNDFYPCQANSEVMSKYINENGLDPRVVDNYEVAFNAVYDQLAQRPAPQPAPAPVVVEPRPSSGVAPSAASAPRPAQRTRKPLVTKEEIKEMKRTPEGRERFRKLIRNKDYADAVNALFAQ